MPSLNLYRVCAIILIPVLLYLTVIAGTRGLADVYARPAITRLNEWKAGKIKIAQDEWPVLISDLSLALRLDKNNPEIHEWLGLAEEGQYVQGSVEWNKASVARRIAAAYYRESINLQPTWPYAWADLATVKYRLREFDDELVEALHKSIQLGPWEPGIRRVVADIGMGIWSRLAGPDQEFILDVTRNSFMYVNIGHVRDVEALIKKHGFIDKVCEKPDGNERLKAYCARNH